MAIIVLLRAAATTGTNNRSTPLRGDGRRLRALQSARPRLDDVKGAREPNDALRLLADRGVDPATRRRPFDQRWVVYFSNPRAVSMVLTSRVYAFGSGRCVKQALVAPLCCRLLAIANTVALLCFFQNPCSWRGVASFEYVPRLEGIAGGLSAIPSGPLPSARWMANLFPKSLYLTPRRQVPRSHETLVGHTPPLLQHHAEANVLPASAHHLPPDVDRWLYPLFPDFIYRMQAMNRFVAFLMPPSLALRKFDDFDPLWRTTHDRRVLPLVKKCAARDTPSHPGVGGAASVHELHCLLTVDEARFS